MSTRVKNCLDDVLALAKGRRRRVMADSTAASPPTATARAAKTTGTRANIRAAAASAYAAPDTLTAVGRAERVRRRDAADADAWTNALFDTL